MPPRREPAQAELDALTGAVDLHGADAGEALEEGLASRQALVVAKAASLIRDLELRDAEHALIESYWRLTADPETLDPVCAAMKEIVATLFEFGTDAPDIYLHAVHHVQHAGWDQQDVGAPLRGLAVQALVKTEHRSALALAADLLVQGLPASASQDDSAWARIGAARALRAMGGESSALLLRMKAHTGDTMAEVYGECFGGMLEYSPAWLHAVAAHLHSEVEGVPTLAALAIGEARPPGGREALREAWETETTPETREAFLDAIASLRSDEAIDFLVGLVGGDSVTAMQALSALTLYAASESVVSQVQDAVKANRRKEVATMFERLFA